MGLFFPDFGLGSLIQVSVLLINAIAILSEDRFLARVGWGNASINEPAFGASPQDAQSVKSKVVNLIASVRTLMRIPLIIINTLIIVWALILG